MQEHLTSTHTWGARNAGVLWARPVAYFSAEFGLHESVPIYSGGLGILAGDHIKAASDLGIPLVGVGLYYDQGYFTQRLDMNGYQQEDYRDVDSSLLPIAAGERCERRAGHHQHRHANGDALRARVEAGRRPEYAAAARLRRRRQPAGGSRSDVAVVWRRRPRPHQTGAAARRGRRQGALGTRYLAGRGAPQRRTQRVRGAGARVSADGDRGYRRRRSAAPNLFAGRVHDAHAGAGRSRSLPGRPRRRASWPSPRRDGHRPRTISWRWGAPIPPTRTKASA